MVMISLRLQPWGCRANIEQRTRLSEESQGTQRLGVGSVSCVDLEITVIAICGKFMITSSSAVLQ